MEWLWENAQAIGTALGAVAAAWTLLAKVKKTLRQAIFEVVGERFATKRDLDNAFGRIETRLDTMQAVLWRRQPTEVPHATQARDERQDALEERR